MKKYLAFGAALVLAFALPLAVAGKNLDAVVSAGPVVRSAEGPTYSEPILLGGGGPDGFGYTWIDSDTAGGPTFGWVGITSGEGGNGTNTGIVADDEMVTINMSPFGFSFYEGNFAAINVCSNGFLSFTFDSTYVFPANQSLPFATITDGLFPFWDDLNPSGGGSIWYWYDSANSRFIIEYYEVMHFGSGGPYTFEVILNANGVILFQYLNMASPTDQSTVGIQGADGSGNFFLEYCRDGFPVGNEPHNNLAIKFEYKKLDHDVKALNIINPIAN